MALITAAIFRQHYPMLVGTGEDALLDLYIARADALMALYCHYPMPDGIAGRTMGVAQYTLYPWPMLGMANALCLDIRPIVSVVSAHADATWAYGPASEVIAADYVVDSDGVLWLPPGSAQAWGIGPRANRVIVTAGYATAPPDLVAICATVVRHLWDLSRVQGQQSHSTFGDTTTRVDMDTLIPEGARALLDAGYSLHPPVVKP